ncbi:MAG: hypothetical protein R3332_08490 [Pseudohongiellaceae bacterium]|nr:hypothetical protein [Pseudohongiellaceae bacterium]
MKVMKDDYYDTEEYQNSIFQRQSKGQEVTYYGNLRNFSKLILLSIYLSFFSALCQISLGYFVNIFTVVICACVAIASWVCVIFSIYQVGENWAKALEYAEDRAAKKWKKVNPPVKERLQQDTIDS